MPVPSPYLTAPSPPFQYPVSWGPDMPPNHQAVWGLYVALAYFLIGLGSMILVVSAVSDLKVSVAVGGASIDEYYSKISKFKASVGITSLLAVALGLFFLVLDAGKPSTAWEIITYGLEYGRWESWMFLGTIFLVLVVLLAIVYAASWLGEFSSLFKWLRSLYTRARIPKYFIVALVVIFGVLGASYGGVLFSLTNVALWRNPVLVVLFPVSGLSSAAATGMLLSVTLIKDESTAHDNVLLWSNVDLYSVIAEAILTALFLAIGVYNPGASESVYQVLFGRFSVYFWTLVITIGIAIPLLLEISLHKISPKYYKYVVPVITILVLVGAASLRYYVVIASAYYYPPLSPFSPIQMQFPWGTVWGE